MAAQDYYNPITAPPQQTYLAPPRPGRASSHPGYYSAPQGPGPYPSSNPPSYHESQLNISQFPNPPALSPNLHPPSPGPTSQPMQPGYDQKHPQPPFNGSPAVSPGLPAAGRKYQQPYPQQPPQPRTYFHPPPSHLHHHPTRDSSDSGYSSEPEPRERRRHHKHRDSQGSRSRGPASRDHRTKDGLIGGAAGGLIGDMIFPGLGTVGGALAGWLGGREHAKHKERQDEIDREWGNHHGDRRQRRSYDGRRDWRD